MKEDFKVILPAHGLPIGKVKGKIRTTIDHRLAREGKLIDALGTGLRGMDELIARVYDDVDQSLWPLAEQTLVAHLSRIGRVVGAGRIVQG